MHSLQSWNRNFLCWTSTIQRTTETCFKRNPWATRAMILLFVLALGQYVKGDCPEGYGYNSETQTCFECEAGTYMSYENTTEDLTYSVGCRPCPAGEFSGAAASSCFTCPAGRYSWAQAASCSYCEAGRYSPPGVRDCILCAPGLYSSGAGFSECLECPVGTFSSSYTGATSCTNCPVGYWSVSGSKRCTACTFGEFLDENKTCSTCPSGTFSIQGEVLKKQSNIQKFKCQKICPAFSWCESTPPVLRNPLLQLLLFHLSCWV